MHRYYRHQDRRHRYTGGRFEWLSNHSVSLKPFETPVCIPVSNGLRRQIVAFATTHYMDLAVSGPGGLHDDYAEQASMCYPIYAAWDAQSDEYNGDLVLFAVPTGTTINAALVAALGDGQYDYWSRCLGFVANNAGSNIIPFVSTGKWFKYHDTDNGEVALNNGVETDVTKVDLTGLVPFEAVLTRLFFRASNTGAANTSVAKVTTKHADLGTVQIWESDPVQAAANMTQWCEDVFDVDVINDTDDLLYYVWSGGAPTGGLDINVIAVQLWD